MSNGLLLVSISGTLPGPFSSYHTSSHPHISTPYLSILFQQGVEKLNSPLISSLISFLQYPIVTLFLIRKFAFFMLSLICCSDRLVLVTKYLRYFIILTFSISLPSILLFLPLFRTQPYIFLNVYIQYFCFKILLHSLLAVLCHRHTAGSRTSSFPLPRLRLAPSSTFLHIYYA